MDTICSVEWNEECRVEALQRSIEKVLSAGAQSICVFACLGNEECPNEIDVYLRTVPVPIFGGIFPNLIYDGRRQDCGVLAIGFSVEVTVTVVANLSNAEQLLEERVRQQCRKVTNDHGKLIIVDGFAKNIELFLESLYSIIGPGADIVGCGAGTLDFVQKPCVMTNDGLLKDAAIVTEFPFEVRRGFQHGWKILDGPFLVTGARGNSIDTLNYRPAFDVYREHVESASNREVTQEDFFSVAKTFPLGMEHFGGDILVRDLLRCANKSMISVGGVPENATVYILQGDESQIIQSAGIAAADARRAASETGTNAVSAAFIFDCVSRLLLLEENFKDELDEMHRALGSDCKTFGVLSIGEITNTPHGPIGLLNKSTVVGVF